LEPKLEYIKLQRGRPLYKLGEPIRHVFFPTYGIVSLLYFSESGASAELGVVGSEGLVGLGVLLGAKTATDHAVVQATGSAYRMPAIDAKATFAEGGEFQVQALRFAQVIMLQVSQTAVCNLLHSVEQHLCRWLLLCLDRLHRNEITMTHELIATMLGVRRQGVTEAAMKLQKRKIITYVRGHITVLDRARLEDCSCECYSLVKKHAAGILAA
jgi:CRP-like cAMP-binding protein